MLYISADTHFGHSKILEFEPRRKTVLGDTIEQHDANLIKRFNTRIKPNDTLIIVGDFGFSTITGIKETLAKLNGTKILVVGNHDKHTFQGYLNAGFSWVCYETKIKIAKEYVRITHHPYRKPWWKCIFPWQYKERDRVKRPIDYGHFLLHGHIHSGGHADGAWGIRGRQINVGVDVNDYKPVALHEVADWIVKIKKEEKTLYKFF